MKAFFYKTLLFASSLLACDALLFWGVLELTTIFTPQELSMAKRLPKHEMLVFGTSHAESAFYPEQMKNQLNLSCYNLGRARRNLAFQAAISRTLIEAGHHPKLVVLTTTYHDWNENAHPYMIYPLLKKEQRFPYFLEILTQREWLQPRRWFLMDRYSSSARMMSSRALSWIKNRQTEYPWIDYHDGGYRPQHQHFKSEEKPEHIKTFPLHILDSNRQAFIELLELWSKAGSKVVVVDPPEFIGSRLSHRHYDQAWKMVEQHCRTKNIPHQSFSNPDTPWLSDSRYFRDGGWGHPNSHLNHKGAIAFGQDFSLWLLEQFQDLQPMPQE